MISFMMMIGIVFLVNADRESVEIHKEYKLLVVNNVNPWLCCRKKKQS